MDCAEAWTIGLWWKHGDEYDEPVAELKRSDPNGPMPKSWRIDPAGMGRYGPHYSPASVVSFVSNDSAGGWADTAHTTEDRRQHWLWH